jgi:hypothetical protein
MARVKTTDADEWRLQYHDGVLTIEMSAEDAQEIEARATEAGLSVEVYMRRTWGFEDQIAPQYQIAVTMNDCSSTKGYDEK